MGFSRQEYQSGLLFPPPGDLPNPGMEPGSPALQTDALPSEPPGKPLPWYTRVKFLPKHVSQRTGKWELWTESLSRVIPPVLCFMFSEHKTAHLTRRSRENLPIPFLRTEVNLLTPLTLQKEKISFRDVWTQLGRFYQEHLMSFKKNKLFKAWKNASLKESSKMEWDKNGEWDKVRGPIGAHWSLPPAPAPSISSYIFSSVQPKQTWKELEIF